MGGKSGGQITGYQYCMSVHMGLCRGPIDAICKIRIDDQLAWAGYVTSNESGDTANTQQNTAASIVQSIFGGGIGGGAVGQTSPYGNTNFYINAGQLFGGDTGEGGVQGPAQVYFGAADQVMEPSFKALMGANCPDFRGTTTLTFSGLIASNNPYLKPWKIRARRALKGWDNDTVWYPETCVISIASTLVRFINLPDAGSYIDLNGAKIYFVAPNGDYTSNDVPIIGTTQDVARAFQQMVNNNPTIYKLVASTDESEFADDPSVTLTLIDPVPNGPDYTISTSATNSNPFIGGPTLNAGGILAMNGAHILYEACTNRAWGRGLPISLMDDVSFRAAALQLYNEGFGLCIKWSQQDTISSLCSTVVEHISAALYVSRVTGLMTLKLLRDDYDPTMIPYFDSTCGLIAVDNDSSTAQDTSFNEIIVKYHDPIQDVDLQVRAQNLASYQANQSTLSDSKDYSGVPTAALALRLAARDLKQQALGLKRFVVKLDQAGRNLQCGDVFALKDPTRDIGNIIMRVGKVESGTPLDQTVTLTCLQDVFSLPSTTYVSTPSTSWSPPTNTPAPCQASAFMEATYRDMAHYLTPANLAAFQPSSGAVVMLALNPGLVSAKYDLLISLPGVTTTTDSLGPWTAGMQLVSAIGLSDTIFQVMNFVDPELAPETEGFAIVIDGEWMRVDNYDAASGNITVGRGCVDTVPQSHLAGAQAFVADFLEVSDFQEYLSGEVVNAQVLAVTSQGVLDSSLAATQTVTIGARQFRPYPPGAVQINGADYRLFVPSNSPTDIVLTWASRNRVLQQDALVDQLMASVTPEAGTTYNIRVYSGATLVRSETGLTALTFTYTAAMQESDAITSAGSLVLEAERDGVVSWTNYNIAIVPQALSPLWDANWGLDWGSNGPVAEPNPSSGWGENWNTSWGIR